MKAFSAMLPVIICALGCEQKAASGVSPVASSSLTGAASAAPVGAASGATAAASPAAKVACPPGSTGAGTMDEPCTPTDPKARLIKVTFVGKIPGDMKFKFENSTGNSIKHTDLKVYFYDGAGKQLKVKLPAIEGEHDHWWSSGRTFDEAGLAANGSVELAPSLLGKDIVPAGTNKVEAEIWLAGWDCPQYGMCGAYWANKALKIEGPRPLGG